MSGTRGNDEEKCVCPGRTARASHRRTRALGVLVLLLSTAGWAQDQPKIDLTQMQLEDLLNVKVTSVSKREEKLSRTAAAVFVIDQEDIRRSGAASLPDLLRMAPGVDVEQVDANAWAISIRGFNARYSNKVLVLIDGRTVYTPSVSGVFWEQLDIPLEDIERIEVIRGPGATVWGANAVNGVISIITKSSKDTKGGLVTAGGGSQLEALGLAQYGGTIGTSGSYRVFGKYFDFGNSALSNGAAANDRWMREHGGFRTDWGLSRSDSLMVQGSIFGNQESQTLRTNFIATPFDRTYDQNFDAGGGDLLARWNHTAQGGSETSLQTYFDTYHRSDLGVPETVRTFDADFQDHMADGGRNDVVWGAGYRVYTSSLAPGYSIGFSPVSRTDRLYSAFLQDELRLADSVWFTIGAKLEHNPYTHFQTEPSARLVWTPANRNTFWASASKADRQPAREDTAIRTVLQTLPIGPNMIQATPLSGNPSIKDEEARDYELGYRSDFSKALSLDFATFLTFYHHLETLEPQAPQIVVGSPMQVVVPMRFDNKAHAVDYGGEVFLNWKVNSRWRLSPGYAYLHATIRRDVSSQGQATSAISTDFPQNQAQIRSQFNLPAKLEFDQSLYYTARLPGGSIPGHARLDVRLGRRLGESAELSIVGQNLLRARTTEYGDSFNVVGTQSVRSVYGKITWRF